MIYNKDDIKERQPLADHILQCLAVYSIWQNDNNYLLSGKKDGWYQFLGYCEDGEVKKAYAMKAEGEAFYTDGYRIKRTGRHITGISISVPVSAIAWIAVTAGHIATSEAFRIDYLIHISSEVMTPTEAEKEFSLASGTVRQYIKTHNAELLGNGSAWKADSRTWLLTRDFVEKTWSKKDQ